MAMPIYANGVSGVESSDGVFHITLTCGTPDEEIKTRVVLSNHAVVALAECIRIERENVVKAESAEILQFTGVQHA